MRDEITTRKKRKVIIATIEVNKCERFKPFGIRLPANVKRVTGILVTASATWERYGTISFQSEDSKDIFHVAHVREDGIELPDEALFKVHDPQFGSDKAWVTGNVPKMIPVSVEGDTTIINGWFKGEAFNESILIRVYLEYEEAEALVSAEGEGQKEDRETRRTELI